MDRTTQLLNAAVALLSVAGMIALAACGQVGSEDLQTSTQQLTGNVPSDVTNERPDIVAVDDLGAVHLFETDDDGNFVLELPSGHTYELFVSEDGLQGLEEASQIVFPRASGDVDGTVTIGGAMAPFDLGEVRPAGTLETASYHVNQASSEDRRPDDAGDDTGDDTADEASESATEELPEEAHDAAGDAPERDEGADEVPDKGEDDEEDEEESDEDGVDCAEGPPGIFCVHDGAHPACEGLSTAASNRGEAGANAAEARENANAGLEIAAQARASADEDGDDAADEHASEHIPENPGENAESAENHEPVDPDRPIALPQFNPPFEFPGCSIQ